MNASSALTELIQILSAEKSYYSEVEDFRKKKLQIDHDIIRVGVLGVTSAGKSTLLNSLLGENLLPAEAKPSSSQLVSCKHGSKREAIVYFTNGSRKCFTGSNLTSDIISKYGNENLNRGNKEQVSQINIISPHLTLPSNVELIDSPGLDAYGLDGHEQITMETLLPSVDFCIFVTTCKTNSDSKMLSVLNSIARFEKPVIIVQNMIDSLRGTPDGTKDVNQVAEEHIQRIKRVIYNSEIKDRTRVDIIQMSAKHALKCRIIKLRGGKLNEKGEAAWKNSGFEKFEELLSQIPKQLSAQININRINSIRLDIQRLIDQLDIHNQNNILIDSSNYRDIYKNIYLKVTNSIKSTIKDIEDYIKSIERNGISNERVISEIKSRHSIWTNKITAIIRTYNEDIVSICKKLNIAPRDMRYSFIPSQASTLRVHDKTITKERKQSGFWGGVKRIFTLGICGYETYTETVPDWEKTYQSILSFLNNAKRDYANQLNGWYKQISKSGDFIEEAIDQRERQIQDAIQRNLEIEKKKEIHHKLNNLLLKLPKGKSGVSNTTNVARASFKRFSKNISPLTFYSYICARYHSKSIHMMTYKAVFNDRKLSLYGWDMSCIELFVSDFAGYPVSSNVVRYGGKFGNITIQSTANAFHHKDSIAVVFVNLTQPGSAKKQISHLLDSVNNILTSDIVFVIQDLQEVITGEDLRNALQDMNEFLANRIGRKKYMWFSTHSNPLYNVCLLELQIREIKNHNEEMILARDLRKRMGDFYESKSENIIADLIRGISSIN